MHRSLVLLIFLSPIIFCQPEPAKLIKLTVVALDKQDHPVRDLTSADFHITDNGKPQTIAFFRRQSAPEKQTEALSPGQYTNQLRPQQHTVVVLMDLLNNRFGSRNYGANEIIHALEKSETHANVYLYFLTLNGSLFPVVALPAPGPSLHPPSPESAGSIQKAVTDAMRTVNQLRPAGILIDQQIDMTFKALSSLGEQMARFAGRKEMVWVTHGTPIEIRMEGGEYFDYTPMLARLSASLNNAGIAVYPVAISDQNLMRSDPAMQTMETVAALTGGVVFARDVDSSIDEASRETDGNYTIEYYPSQAKPDGKYHKLKVTCARKNVRLVSEQGYYSEAKQQAGAPAPTKPDAAWISDALRNAALMSPDDYTSIPVTATVTTEGGSPPAAHVDLHVDISTLLPIDEQRAGYQGQIAITAAAYDTDSQPLVSAPKPMNFTAAGKEVQDGLTYSLNLPLGPKVYCLRFVVVDANTKSVGSLTIPVKPPR